MFHLENFNPIGYLLKIYILPSIFVIAAITYCAYRVSKGKRSDKKTWIIPALFTLTAIVIAFYFSFKYS